MRNFTVITGIVLSFFLLSNSCPQANIHASTDSLPLTPEYPSFLNADSLWVDSILNSMNLDEKIAQLLMIAAYSNRNDEHLQDLIHTVQKYGVGGLIFFQGGPARQAIMTNKLQKESKIPLLVAIDAEWGLAMRLDSTISYPKQMMPGASSNPNIIYQMGLDIGKQLKRLGIHMNFAPVADVNNNPANPVINMRSFGENPERVAIQSYWYAKGLSDAGILAVYKHFPGHGDTQTDSHYDLPVITHERERLDSVELMPFRHGIYRGIPAIMSAHLNIPALDTTSGLASSLSPRIINEFLKDSLGFQGLIVTDAMNMKGVSAYFKPGEADAMAYLAGNDILLMPADVPKAIASIRREIKQGSVSEQDLDERVRKILLAKAWAGLKNLQPIETKNLTAELNAVHYEIEKRKLIRNSLVLLKNDGMVVPFLNPENYRIAAVTLGNGKNDAFTENLNLYVPTDTFLITPSQILKRSKELLDTLKSYNTLIVSVQKTSEYPSRNYGITPEVKDFLKNLEFNGNSLLVLFGNPYMLGKLDSLHRFNSIVLAADDTPLTHFLTAQAIFGASAINGTLPVEGGPGFPAGTGIASPFIERLAYGIPEEAGLNSQILRKIDTIALEAISMKATPGCQVLVARNGRVVFQKAYGKTAYDGRTSITNDHIYDLASLTKITATLPAMMKLYGEGILNLNAPLGNYLEIPDTSNKKDLTLREILAHQAGLQAWIPFYYSTIEPLDTSEQLLSTSMSDTYPYKVGTKVYANRNICWKEGVYSHSFSESFPYRVAGNMFIHKSWTDSVYNTILSSELLSKTYRYSDMGYYLFQKMLEDMTETPLLDYARTEFYAKMGAATLGYNPLERFPASRIAPTENDMVFRKQLLRGDVHDPGAAMMGGVAGHAGLFSNANDLAKFMQMYLNGGTYGGRTFLPDTVISRFSTRAFTTNGNRRALGFDKPEANGKSGPACPSAPPESYGHTGFTGTMVWIDPVNDLLYIFLSNRIHPNQFNNLLIEKDIRTKIQQVIYDAIIPLHPNVQ